MGLIDKNYLDNFLNSKNYDIRITNNARWIDQKCTPDVITIVADCILEYISNKNDQENFTSSDIWHNNYTIQNVQDIFKKPSLVDKSTKNEYDKFFQQPMEMLSYAGVLKKQKKGMRNFYQINDKLILENISLSERSALEFLIKYITKVLKDSNIDFLFNNFFQLQNKEAYIELKNGFILFTKENTPINGDKEASRIFTKIINPLSYDKNSFGTEHGQISKDLITYDMLMYNRNNFRDIWQRKPKGIARKMYTLPSKSDEKYIIYLTNKAMKNVKLFNRYYNSNLSEVDGDKEIATETHHIFPRSKFPEISFFLENLINLTPNQHRNHAHPNAYYYLINIEFQKICLIAKIGTIKKSIENDWGDYNFNNFIYVINTGYKTNIFSNINEFDYDEVIKQINIINV